MSFFYVFILSILVNGLRLLIKRKREVYQTVDKTVKKNLEDVVEQYEKNNNLEKFPVDRLRALNVHLHLKDDETKEKFRNKLVKEVQNESYMNRLILFFLLNLFVQFTAIFVIYKFLPLSKLFVFSLLALLAFSFYGMLKKPLVLKIFYLAFGIGVFYVAPSTIAFYLFLNLSYRMSYELIKRKEE